MAADGGTSAGVQLKRDAAADAASALGQILASTMSTMMCRPMMLMSGLSKVPRAQKLDVAPQGRVLGMEY